MMMAQLKHFLLQSLICFPVRLFGHFVKLELTNVANEVVKDWRNKYHPNI